MTAPVDVEAALAWRDFMVSDYANAGQERWLASTGIDLLRGRLAGPGVVEVDGVRHTAELVVVATGFDPIVPPVPGPALPGLRSVAHGAPWITDVGTARRATARVVAQARRFSARRSAATFSRDAATGARRQGAKVQ